MIVAHLDLDAFFAAVEELENPELRRVPLVVGGDPNGRGVAATANYVARGFGTPSARGVASASPPPGGGPRRGGAARGGSSSARATGSTATTRARCGRRSARSCRR